jgi:hypothetical protein
MVEQVELPGCEPDLAGALQRKADSPLKPSRPQEPCDVGLFSDHSKQVDLVDRLRKTLRGGKGARGAS